MGARVSKDKLKSEIIDLQKIIKDDGKDQQDDMFILSGLQDKYQKYFGYDPSFFVNIVRYWDDDKNRLFLYITPDTLDTNMARRGGRRTRRNRRRRA